MILRRFQQSTCRPRLAVISASPSRNRISHPIALHHSVPISKPRPFSVRAPFSTTTQRCQFTPSIKTANMSDYETILKGKYPAKDHAKRVADHIRSKIPGANGILYLEGRHTKLEEDSDHPEPFRQRRYFFYLTGCILADCHYIFDLKTSQSTLFIPPVDPEDVIWSGMPMTAEEAKEKYDVDNVLYTNDVNAELARLGKGSGSTAFAIANQVLDTVSFIEFEDKNFDVLKGAIEECRVVKDDYEVALTRKANAISTTAHHAVMKAVSKAKNEQELEAIFLERCFAHGLGHYLGMDTHDVGGTPNYADSDPMFRYLRKRGTLPAGSLVTVEPGIYFCSFIIEPYLKDPTHSKYIDTDILDKYWDVGGVRIEDNLLITKTGSENLTPTIKEPEEIEKFSDDLANHLGIDIDIAGRRLSKSYLHAPIPVFLTSANYNGPQDVWTLEDTNELLSVPVLALVLVFPTTPAYDARAEADDADADDWMVTHQEEDEDAMWFKQTIHNACGLYAILHALANGRAKDFIQPGSVLDTLFSITAPMDPAQAAMVLETSKEGLGA
ncbi:hypothetical protein BN1708_014934, partial [Verticillium longisporum]